MLSTKCVYKYIYLIYTYKEDLALNNLQYLKPFNFVQKGVMLESTQLSAYKWTLAYLKIICLQIIYEVHTISFQTFFVWAFKIVIDSWKFTMLFLYILWDDWLIFMISGSNEQVQQEFKYTLLKPDCHSCWI